MFGKFEVQNLTKVELTRQVQKPYKCLRNSTILKPYKCLEKY